jgi:WD40 repeat protein
MRHVTTSMLALGFTMVLGCGGGSEDSPPRVDGSVQDGSIASDAGDVFDSTLSNDASEGPDAASGSDASPLDAEIRDAMSRDAASVDAVVLDDAERRIVEPLESTLTSEPISVRFGHSAALSADGNWLAVGDNGYGALEQLGGVFLYQRMAGRFVQTQVLRNPYVGAANFGCAVALSPDGSTLAVGDDLGGSTDGDNGPGRVYLFERSGSAFGTSPSQIFAGPSARSYLGVAVAFSGDGQTLAIGMLRDKVRIHRRTSGRFGDAPSQAFGIRTDSGAYLSSLALSSDGSTLAVGDASYGGGPRRGAVHIYLRGATDFATTPSQTISAPTEGLEFGWDVAFDEDDTLYIGDPGFGSSRGAVRVYQRSSDSFVLDESECLVGPDMWSSEFGTGVDVAGSTLIVSDPTGGEISSGVVNILTRASGAAFGPTPTQTLGRGSAGYLYGQAVAVASDGSFLAVGDPAYARGRGAVHFYGATDGSFSGPPRQTLLGPADSFAFGTSLALSRDDASLLVGEAVTVVPSAAGGVYEYLREGDGFATTPRSTLLPPPPSSTTGAFGASIALSPDGTLLAVGDPNEGFMTVRPGKVLLFARSAGGIASTAAATITPPEGSVDFGSSLAFSPDGETLIVGDSGRGASGAIHVYRFASGAFGPTPTATRAGPSTSRDFGASVAFSPDGRALLVGDPEEGASRLGAVSLYAFGVSGVSSTPLQTVRLAAPSAGFGASLSVSSRTAELFVGDIGYGNTMSLSGAVHRYELR